jgi:hypothetical protein
MASPLASLAAGRIFTQRTRRNDVRPFPENPHTHSASEWRRPEFFRAATFQRNARQREHRVPRAPEDPQLTANQALNWT